MKTPVIDTPGERLLLLWAIELTVVLLCVLLQERKIAVDIADDIKNWAEFFLVATSVVIVMAWVSGVYQ